MFGANCFLIKMSDIFFFSKFYNIYKSLFISRSFPVPVYVLSHSPDALVWVNVAFPMVWLLFWADSWFFNVQNRLLTVWTLVRLNSELSGLRASVVPACKVELEPVVGSISSLKNIAIAFKKGFKILSCHTFYFNP